MVYKLIRKRIKLIAVIIGLITPIFLAYKTPRQGYRQATIKPYDFNAQNFKKPSLKWGPFTRWWWPGNDVTSHELQREVQLFAKNGFAGVEIQPLTVGINPESTRLDSIYSWNTPAFYTHVQAVMHEAIKAGISVDMNAGSGWPLGGPFVKPNESLLTMRLADTIVNGGDILNINIPSIKKDYSELLRNGTVVYNAVDLSLARLQAITAAKIIKQANNKIYLDSSSITRLNQYVKNGILLWHVPIGSKWSVMAFYTMPDGEKPLYIATKKTSWVTDIFDPSAIIKSYNQLFGAHTGLEKYYGNPFRAIFNDSKEFITDRHISKDFIKYFKEKRNYDITPWLAPNAIKGYDNAYSFGRDTVPKYVFSDQDWRLRYDYDLTVSDLYKERFAAVSRRWTEAHGLLHRSQDYGIKLDIIGASGLASIPEAEQLFGGGSEGFIKLVTSGAHLYNRPIVSQESFVFSQRAGMTTPQKIKAFANKSFAAGINQIIYHGTPYKYLTADYGAEGWTAWSTPFKNYNYSSNISESYNYWKYIKDINTFIARTQYVLQSGKPVADVLIYSPFINMDASQVIRNPEETCINGALEGIEPFGAGSAGSYKKNPSFIEKWFMDTWPLINQLEENGITWDFVNDESLLSAHVTNHIINIRNNFYKALIIANTPYMPLKSAKQVMQLAQNGIKMLVVGNMPSKQPGYLNYQANDLLLEASLKNALKCAGVVQLPKLEKFNTWANKLSRPVKFNGLYDFTRQIQRIMPDGNLIQFIWNKTDQLKTISLTLDKKYKNSYWLNPEDGSIIKNKGNLITCKLQPYSAVILYATAKTSIPENLLSPVPVSPVNSKPVSEIRVWDLSVGNFKIPKSSLFDWRKNDSLKYVSDTGIYKASFNLNKENNKSYSLDMGSVYATAEVIVNGKKGGKRLWAPYELDITRLLKKGKNTIEIIVTPANRNHYIGEGAKGNHKYIEFKGLDKTLMPAGLVGPVVIKEYQSI